MEQKNQTQTAPPQNQNDADVQDSMIDTVGDVFEGLIELGASALESIS